MSGVDVVAQRRPNARDLVCGVAGPDSRAAHQHGPVDVAGPYLIASRLCDVWKVDLYPLVRAEVSDVVPLAFQEIDDRPL